MTEKIYETAIIGAGISGLACALKLQEEGRDFIIISKDIGGRILTSEDNNVNYGAYFVCSDYKNVLNHVALKSRIKLSDFCFHNFDKKYVLYEPSLIMYLFQLIKIKKLLYKFRKSLRELRKITLNISQKKGIENDPFLYSLYMKNAKDFVEENKLEKGTKKYLSQGLYSTTFSQIHEMNAFSFLQYLLPLVTPIYTFSFEKERMIDPFRNKIIKGIVKNISYKNNKYGINFNEKTIYSKNLVLATQIDWSKKFSGVNKTNKPVSTNMFHIKGKPFPDFSKKLYQLFTPPSNEQAIADLNNGTYLFYYRDKQPKLKHFFIDYSVIAHHHWHPAGTINGHTLIECNRGNNMYLIGDFNIAGLEESFITGVYAANQIIKSC